MRLKNNLSGEIALDGLSEEGQHGLKIFTLPIAIRNVIFLVGWHTGICEPPFYPATKAG